MQKPPHGALFDVKPVDDNGSVDIARMNAVQAVVNLSSSSHRNKKIFVQTTPSISSLSVKKSLPRQSKITQPKDFKQEFESALNEATDLQIELAKFSQTHQFVGRPRYRPILPTVRVTQTTPFPEFDVILTEINRSRAAAARVPEMTAMIALATPVASQGRRQETRRQTISRSKWKPTLRFWLGLVIVAVVLAILAASGWGLKQRLTARGNSAVADLQNAKTDLENLNFDDAAKDFTSAYQSFASISSFIAALPGGGTVKSVQNLVKIGKLISDSGAAMAQAAKALAEAGSLFTPGDTAGPSISSVMLKLQTALAISYADISDVKALLADIDASIIPEDNRAAFEQLSAFVPTIEQVVGRGADYAKFFADATGQPGTHRYLLLFENSSELRPTGGFPGSYGVVTFKDGKLADFFVDDVYNLDGQIKQPVIPPVPLQHITPDWGMRDANWFADFPTSARVIEDFYFKESGQRVDGVITINPSLVTDILKVMGPISMSQYSLTLNADNFVTAIQNQIEYVADRAQPKQVMKDFAPLLMAKLRTASSDQWLAIFNSVIANIDKHAVLMYFNNLKLETFPADQGFAGQIYQGSGDYIMPVISNVKGSKTDAVTDTSLALTTEFDGSDAIHTLTITRTHNGGNEKYAFYNKQNPAYIRVLVPANAELVGIQGDDSPNFKPIINYKTASFNNFITNDTLVKFEASGMEAGKKEFQFWLIVDAGKTKTVTVVYRVPKALDGDTYNLYVQKQPGLVVKNFSTSVGNFIYDAPLEKDLPIKVELP